MKTIIAGSRTITDEAFLWDVIHASGFKISEVVYGDCRGVDRIGKVWAFRNNLPTKCFPAAWQTQGKAAGPIRNEQMAQYADALIAVWDGKSNGTKDMIDKAKKKGLQVYVEIRECQY